MVDRGLVLEVRLLGEPCLWCWEIRAGVDGRLVESSWVNEWAAFASRTDAVAAGTRRLTELVTVGSVARETSGRPAPRIVPAPTRRAG